MVSAYAQQSRLMPFDYAAQVTHLPAALLRKLVRDSVVPGEAPFRVQGFVGYCDIEAAQRVADELKTARAGLEGRGIRPAEAADKYAFGRDNIYKWLRKGWIRQIQSDSSDEILVDEGDVAVARALARLVGQGQGKPVFPKGDGPYISQAA